MRGCGREKSRLRKSFSLPPLFLPPFPYGFAAESLFSIRFPARQAAPARLFRIPGVRLRRFGRPRPTVLAPPLWYTFPAPRNTITDPIRIPLRRIRIGEAPRCTSMTKNRIRAWIHIASGQKMIPVSCRAAPEANRCASRTECPLPLSAKAVHSALHRFAEDRILPRYRGF